MRKIQEWLPIDVEARIWRYISADIGVPSSDKGAITGLDDEYCMMPAKPSTRRRVLVDANGWNSLFGRLGAFKGQPLLFVRFIKESCRNITFAVDTPRGFEPCVSYFEQLNEFCKEFSPKTRVAWEDLRFEIKLFRMSEDASSQPLPPGTKHLMRKRAPLFIGDPVYDANGVELYQNHRTEEPEHMHRWKAAMRNASTNHNPKRRFNVDFDFWLACGNFPDVGDLMRYMKAATNSEHESIIRFDWRHKKLVWNLPEIDGMDLRAAYIHILMIHFEDRRFHPVSQMLVNRSFNRFRDVGFHSVYTLDNGAEILQMPTSSVELDKLDEWKKKVFTPVEHNRTW